MSVEPSVDHPFFVLNCGWSSCNPQKTYDKYGLTVRQLQVGDLCVSLTKTVSKQKTKKQQQPKKLPPETTVPDTAMPPLLCSVTDQSSSIVSTASSSSSGITTNSSILSVAQDTPKCFTPDVNEAKSSAIHANSKNSLTTESTKRFDAKSPTMKGSRKVSSQKPHLPGDEQASILATPINLSLNSPQNVSSPGKVSPINLKTSTADSHLKQEVESSVTSPTASPEHHSPAAQVPPARESIQPLIVSEAQTDGTSVVAEVSSKLATSSSSHRSSPVIYQRISPVLDQKNTPPSSSKKSSPSTVAQVSPPAVGLPSPGSSCQRGSPSTSFWRPGVEEGGLEAGSQGNK